MWRPLSTSRAQIGDVNGGAATRSTLLNVDERESRVRWWPKKLTVPTGPNMVGEPVIGTQYAWWPWRQRLRTRSVRNLERWYLQPIVFDHKRI